MNMFVHEQNNVMYNQSIDYKACILIVTTCHSHHLMSHIVTHAIFGHAIYKNLLCVFYGHQLCHTI